MKFWTALFLQKLRLVIKVTKMWKSKHALNQLDKEPSQATFVSTGIISVFHTQFCKLTFTVAAVKHFLHILVWKAHRNSREITYRLMSSSQLKWGGVVFTSSIPQFHKSVAALEEQLNHLQTCKKVLFIVPPKISQFNSEQINPQRHREALESTEKN